MTVNELTLPAAAPAPAWLAAEMPPGYQTRLFEIRRLSSELEEMDAIGRVLWESGATLMEAVAAVFRALECELDAGPGTAGSIPARLGPSRRLLLVGSSNAGPTRRTDEELARAFQAVQFATEGDRVVLVPGNDREKPPASRPDPVLPEALDILERMGVNVLPTAAVFRLWRLSLEDRAKARKALEQLHAQDGGLFVLPVR
ncbi:MAG TPA: hypothetical protein VK911_12945 [Vicinamibacterales bacterium]|nr:hypothetical protein [Vicinamibacterales bacterium]